MFACVHREVMAAACERGSISFCMLFYTRDGDWSLYRFGFDEGEDLEGRRPVSEATKLLLYSAERYPPFMAITQDAVMKVSRELDVRSPEELELAVGAALSALFRHQRDFRFPMVLVKEGDLDIHAGTWHWVIGFARKGRGQVTVADQTDDELVLRYQEEPNLIVISADEISYPWPARCFELEEEVRTELLLERPGQRAMDVACSAIREAILTARPGQGARSDDPSAQAAD